MMPINHWRSAALLCLSSFCLMSAAGCGKNLYSTARVTGTVMCDGKPATGGTIVLRPVDAPEKTKRPKYRPGQRATGQIKADGSFTLVLDAVGSDTGRTGALTGPHEVIFRMPQTEPTKIDPSDEKSMAPEDLAKMKQQIASEKVYPSLACGRAIAPDTVEVKSGSNVFAFKLLPKSDEPPSKPKRRGADLIEEYIKLPPGKY